MSITGRSALFVFGLTALLSTPEKAEANLCLHLVIGQRASDEAAALRSEFGAVLPNDPSTGVNESATLKPRREYNARVIQCNRQRDSHGEDIEAAIPARHDFRRNLEPRTVKGHYQYGPGFSLRYAYQIERRDGTWIITVPIRFHWPDSRMTDKVDIPMELADSLKLSAAGGICAPGSTVLENKPRNRAILRGPILDDPSSAASVAKKDRMFYNFSSACRVRRNLVVLDRSVLDHLRDYWRREIKGIWNRDNFRINPVFIDCEEEPRGTRDSCDRVSDAEMSAWTKDETIWNVHFNLDPNHRPAFKRFVGKWNNMHTGVDGEVVAHELGHYLGLDDEYDLLPENLPLTSQELDDAVNLLDLDCRQFNPDAGDTYLMCAHFAGRAGAQGLYPWIITRRYAIAQEFQCRQDTDCAGAEYCDRGWATVGRNQCLPRRGQGDSCERNEQCIARADCKGLPASGRCVIPASVGLNGACIHDSQCTTGSCSNDRRVCQCKEDNHCGTGSYCAVGFLGVGQNSCQRLQADNESCPVADGGRTCAGGHCAWGRCYTPGAVRMGGTCYVNAACAVGKCSSVQGTRGTCVCDADSDCGSGSWCDRGADLTRNSCRAKLAKGAVCGTVGELGAGHRCRSGTCTVALNRPGQLTCK